MAADKQSISGTTIGSKGIHVSKSAQAPPPMRRRIGDSGRSGKQQISYPLPVNGGARTLCSLASTVSKPQIGHFGNDINTSPHMDAIDALGEVEGVTNATKFQVIFCHNPSGHSCCRMSSGYSAIRN
jgi:hypothetical protein